MPRSRPSTRRAYLDDGYGQRFERQPPPPSYREARTRDYDTIPGSKRSYSAMDDAPPPRYADAGELHSRARMDYELGGSTSQYREFYGERLGRSSMGYGSSRSSMSGQDSNGLYSSSRQGMSQSYGGGSYGGSEAGGMYSSSYGPV